MSISITFERRPFASFSFTLLVLLSSLCVGTLGAALLFLLRGVHPVIALQKIFLGSFGSWYGFQETTAKAIPLALTGTGLAIAFRARFWNIGAEGQILAGAVGATAVALYGPQGGSPAGTICLLFIAGAVCGALWACIPALLRLRWQVNEVISTLMMNYIAIELVQFLIYGPWKGKSQMGFPYSDDFPATAVLPTWGYTRIHLPTLVLTLAAAGGLWFLLQRLTFGYEIRVSGENPSAAAYAGIPSGRVLLTAMLISGALAGCAGVGEVAGIHRHLTYPWAISSGYGYTAIIVAWLARLNPLAVIVSALFFGGILVGGDVFQTSLQLPFAVVHLFNALILVSLIVGDVLLEYRPRLRRSSTPVFTSTDQHQEGR